MPSKITQYQLLPLYHKFINQLKKGKRLQANGKRIRSGSIKNYEYLQLLLVKFVAQKQFTLRFNIITAHDQKQFDEEKKYWKDFYFSFTSFLYDNLGHYDNYVGRNIKMLRCFFNYLKNEQGLNIGNFHSKFYAPAEEIEIIVIQPERLNYLIHSNELNKKLNADLLHVKDVVVFGCSVALRFSDLMALTKLNVETINNRSYIRVQSKKTQTYTRVKLPPYALDILKKYSHLPGSKLLPQFTKAFLNKKIKVLMELAGFTEPIIRTRQKRGLPRLIYKNEKSKTPFRFCDVVTTHTMRRSAITTMLSLGMNEQMVRQISGHAPNSKEFYRYVAFAQTFIDTEIDQVHERLSKKQLKIA